MTRWKPRPRMEPTSPKPRRWRSTLERSFLERPGRKQSEHGVILFTALWALSLLSLMAMGLMMVSRTDRLLSRNALATVRAELAAEAGIAHGIAALVARNPNDLWPIDGTPRNLEIDGFQVKVAIQDELGKVDINQASEELLSNLFVALGMPRQKATTLADAIADWRDVDDMKRLNGAEANEYQKAGLHYRPRNSPFETVEELRLVLGVSPEILQSARRHLTVYSQRTQVSAQTAGTLVRAALTETQQSPRRSAPVTVSSLSNLAGQAFRISVVAQGKMDASTLRFMGGVAKPLVVME